MHSFPEHTFCDTGVGTPKRGTREGKESREGKRERKEGKKKREGRMRTTGVGKETYHACDLVRTVLITLAVVPG